MGTGSRERIETAIRLGKPDRVPIVPIIDFFSSRYGGITQREMFFEPKKADLALIKTVRDLGEIDGQNLTYAGLGRMLQTIFPSPPIIPGIGGVPDDAQFQFVEKSVMGPEGYDDLARNGAFKFMIEQLKPTHPEIGTTSGVGLAVCRTLADAARIRTSIRRARKHGIESIVGTNITFTPLEWISIALRSFNDFMLDLFRYPEDMKKASRSFMGFFKFLGVTWTRMTGVRRVFLGGNRTSAAFISPKQFEEFAWPEWEEMCLFFIDRGITPLLHLDDDWAPFYHYFADLPRGKCIMNLDGSSDIFRAKEVLGDRMCIMGDVPAAMLKLADPGDVDEYCRRLITELGADGGFILSSGCTIPPDAKPENVKAMFASVKRYRP